MHVNQYVIYKGCWLQNLSNDMIDDLEELLGPREPVAKLKKPLSGEDIEARLKEHTIQAEAVNAASFMKPVSVQFLSRVFGAHANTIQARLKNCPVAEIQTHKGQPVNRYDFRTACQYLVEPRVELHDWIKNQKQFPPDLQKAFWSGQREKQRWQLEAGELWHSEDVLEVLGRAFMEMKVAITLWVERMPGAEEMLTEQYGFFQDQCRTLIDEIHHRMIEMPKNYKTKNVRDKFESENDDS